MYYIGIDLGGTNIKAGVCDENGKILIKDSVKTHVEKGLEYVVDTMSGLALDLVKRQGLTVDDIEYIGVATPGTTARASLYIALRSPSVHIRLPKR